VPQPGHEAIDALAEPLSPAPGLASRGDRLLAAIADSFVVLAVAIPFGIYDGRFSAALQGRPVPPGGVCSNLHRWLGVVFSRERVLAEKVWSNRR